MGWNNLSLLAGFADNSRRNSLFIRMPFLITGINHRSAPVEIREKVIFAGDELPEALRELVAIPGVRESVIVSTCNRTELYCYSENENAPLTEWLAHWHDLAAHNLHEGIHGSIYKHTGPQAIGHAFGVACGLDSMILGEPQILGQLKDAYRAALEQGATGPFLNRLFQTAFSVAKRVRTQTRIGSNSVSVASAAVGLAKTVFEKFDTRTALLVGAGETIALAARHLYANGVRRMIVANRTLERAQELASELNGYAVTLDAIGTHLAEADIIISSTASPTPVITRKEVEIALRARKQRPMFIVDIAVPRDVEPEVASLENVYFFSIDDLQNVVSENLASRREAARSADVLIATEIALFEQQLKVLEAAPTIRHLREDAQAITAHTTEQAKRMLAAGRDPREVVDFLAATLTNRLLHTPSQRLRQAAEHNEPDLIRAAQELFELKDDES
jgi:glutamyl-tRNA reductase